MSEQKKHFRRPNLDGLRALAVLLVLFHHTTNITEGSSWLQSFMLTGWNGIYLFFILSGFLIGTVILKEIKLTGDFSAKNFWGRRILRTWPVYFILMGFYIWRTGVSFEDFWSYLIFGQNFTDRKFYISTWSLAVQEQFYLFLPLVIMAMIYFKKISENTLTLFFSTTILLGIVGLYTQLHVVQFGALLPLMSGVLLAHADVNNWKPVNFVKSRSNLFLVLGLVTVYAPFFFMKTGFWFFMAQSLGFLVFVMSCLANKNILSPILNSKLALWAASVSYSTYLFQDRPIIRTKIIADHLGLQGDVRFYFLFLGSVVGSFICGAILYKIFERPFMNIRKNMFPSRVNKTESDTLETAKAAS